MPHKRAYALVEFVVTIVVLAITIAFAAVFISRARQNARREQSNTQVRGIIQGLINFSPGGWEIYPGLSKDRSVSNSHPGLQLTATRDPIPPTATQLGTSSINGYEPRYRFTVMLRNNYFSPEYAISPMEINASKRPARFGEDIDHRHFSFAMLRIDAGEGRQREWGATTNALAAVVSDRNLAGAGQAVRGIHDPSRAWMGTVGYNDMHATYEKSNILTGTKYTEAGEVMDADDLFANDTDSRGREGFDAGMVHQDENTFVNQR